MEKSEKVTVKNWKALQECEDFTDDIIYKESN
jgi:hypothetical protein